MVRMFVDGSRHRDLIPRRVIRKTQMALDAALLNAQHYKELIKSKWSNPEKGVASSPLHIGVVGIEKGAFRSSSTSVGQLIHTYIYIYIYISLLPLGKV